MNKDIEFFNSCADNWDNIRQTNPAILEKLISLADIPANATVLDVGSGTGVLIPYLHAQVGACGKITAVDFSENMLAKAQEKFCNLNNVNFLVGDILEMELPQNFYDVVICLNFFPHLHTHKEEFLRKMNSLLKNGGCLIVMHDISRATVNNIHRESEVVAEHRLAEAQTVGKMFEAYGYQNIHAYEDDTLYFVKGVK